jgi:CHAT domain-containing protein
LIVQDLRAETGESGSSGSQLARNSDAELLARLQWLREQGQYREAADEARAALKVLESEGRGAGPVAASVTDSLVSALIALKSATDEEALALAQRAVALRESGAGGDPSLRAGAVFNLARVHGAQDDVATGLDVATRGLMELESAEGFSAKTAADGRRVIGELHIMQGDFEEARSWLEDAVSILSAMEDPETLQLAETLLPLGFSLRGMSAFEDAQRVINRSIDLYTARFGPGHPEVARGLMFLGQTQRDSGQLNDASVSFERSAAIMASVYGNDSLQLSGPLNGIGLTLLDLGDYVGASAAFERAIAIHRQAGASDRNLHFATMLSNYGILRSRMGNNEAALRLFEESSRIQEQVLGPDHPSVAYPVANRGVLLAEMGRYEEAYPLIARGVDIRLRAYGPDSLMFAYALMHFVVYYQGTGDIAAAEEYAVQSLRIKERLLPEQHIDIGKTEQIRSELAHDRGDIETALRLARRTVHILEAALGPAAPDVAWGRLWIAYLLARQQDFAASLEEALRGEDIGRESASIMFRGLAERQALEYAGSRANGRDLLVTIATESPNCCVAGLEQIFDRVIRARALATDEMIRRRSLGWLTEDAEGRMRAAELGETARILAQLTLQGAGGIDPADHLRKLAEAQENHQLAELALAGYSERFRSDLQYARAGYAEVVSALPAGSALVAFIRYTQEDLAPGPAGSTAGGAADFYAAFIQKSAKEPPVALKLADAVAIDAAVSSLRDLLGQESYAAGRSSKRSEQAFRDAAKRLRSLVWDPVAVHLGDGVHMVLVVPDGSLNFVNFAALPDTGSAYLAVSGPVFHYLSSERDVVQAPRQQASPRLLAIGAPDFDERSLFSSLAKDRPAKPAEPDRSVSAYRALRSACGSFDSIRFGPLPASSREVTEIVDIWRRPPGADGTAIVMTGARANEGAFKRAAAGNQVLHFATHGFFIGTDCAPGYTADADWSSVAANPLLLSGLVMAGANHRDAAAPDEEDGILTAEEIGTLNLRGTEWAVLSACDTGAGEIRDGEGVFGLRRAFRMAGVRTTIMSLWAIEDESAREWISALYRHHFAEGASTSAAVRQASVEVLQRRRDEGLSTHPYYWAGFVAAGDWR